MTRSPLSAPSTRCCLSFTASRLVTTALFILLASHACSAAYYGKLIGKLSQLHHGVSGEVYAVDGRTLHIKDFTYDGEGPAAYFYVGSSKNPNSNGLRVRDERGISDVLKKYRKKDITLTLPEGKTLNNIKWFSVYCDEFAVNFGDVRIPRGFDYPRPQKLAQLNGVHGVSSEPIVVVDAQTFLIPGFSYDGEAPDAKFWVGSGSKPSPQGIRVPDENGKSTPLRLYRRKTIVLTLPGDLTIHQIGHFGVWCEAFTVDFGHVQIPSNLNVPPSLKMLGVSPQSKLNCEVLEDSLALEVRWAVAGDSIVVQLVGKLDAGQYMSFGVSSNPERSVMVGGDVVVAWVDKQTLQGYAIDYFLEAKSQCSGGHGSCPDTRLQDNTNSVRLLNAAMVNGYSIVTYQRPLKASDELDRAIRINGSQAVLWAVGPLNERDEVSFHSHYLKNDRFIEFGRPPVWNCPMPDGDFPRSVDDSDKENKQELVATTRRPQRLPATPAPAATNKAWVIPPIQCNEPEDGVLYAQMGPTGGKHGYPAITGHVGWGISWYINGLLIPEIYVVRGKKYVFVTEGGDNPEIPARYHPFYITDDPIGGYEHKTPEEKSKVKIFAGVRRQRGQMVPTGVGRLCNWIPDEDIDADNFASFGAYQRHLTLTCDSGEQEFLEWTPDANTPDTVYYQCFTHRYLGWKIHVVDSCDLSETAASDTREVYVAAPQFRDNENTDLESESSIRSTSKVTKPAQEFYDNQNNNNNDNNNIHNNDNNNNNNNNHHHHHHHRNPDQDRATHYQLHHQHYNDPHYKIASNTKNLAMNSPMNMITTKNPHNNNKIIAQSTAMRLNSNVGGVIVNYDNNEPYELTLHSQTYDEHPKSLPIRHSLFQPTKSIIIPHNHQNHQNNNNNNHHALHHLAYHQAHGVMRSPIGHMEAYAIHRSRPRIPLSNYHPPSGYYRDAETERGESMTIGWPIRNPLTGTTSVNADYVNVAGNNHQPSTDNDQEVHQSANIPIVALSASNQASSNLVADHRPIVNHGQMMKYNGYGGSGQYHYNRPMNNNPNNNPQKTGQFMIIRRPIVHVGQQQQLTQRRPLLGSMMIGTGQENDPRPVFMERKKATTSYHPQKNHIGMNTDMNDLVQQKKSVISDMNKRTMIESKSSTDAITIDNVDRDGQSVVPDGTIKPARNTGFDPDSIVIESGFKPIIRNPERDTSAGRSKHFNERNVIESYHHRMDDDDDVDVDDDDDKSKIVNKNVGQENFEPMFVASPMDRDGTKKRRTTTNNRIDYARNKMRNTNDMDDMEMAADRLESFYLPPSGINEKTIEDRVGTIAGLVAYDGKRVDDSNLARSLPRIDRNRSRGRLTSDVLTRTPQFGKFRGELPPPIPNDVRKENLPQLEPHRTNIGNHDVGQYNRGITKLKPLERTKRSSKNLELSVRSSRTNENLTMNERENGKSASSIEYDHDNRNEREQHEKSTQTSTGQMVINEMPYVILTIVLYFAI